MVFEFVKIHTGKECTDWTLLFIHFNLYEYYNKTVSKYIKIKHSYEEKNICNNLAEPQWWSGTLECILSNDFVQISLLYKSDLCGIIL